VKILFAIQGKEIPEKAYVSQSELKTEFKSSPITGCGVVGEGEDVAFEFGVWACCVKVQAQKNIAIVKSFFISVERVV